MTSDATRPNVLLLVVDTLRADHLSSYGYARPTTPRLDRLSREGILFEQAQSPSSWTLPSHASLMTGRLPHEHRAGDPLRPFLDRRFPTVAERFRDTGYATGAFVANTFWAGHHMGLGRGFATYRDYITNARDAITRPVAGRKFGWELAPRFGWRLLQQPNRADWIHQQLTDWIDGLAGRSFFAFVNYMDVHGPYLGTPPFTTMFGQPVGPDAPVLLAPTNDQEAAEATSRLHQSIDSYDGSLAYLDHEIGALLDGLDQRGLAANTVIVVTSDHGESFGEHGFVNHGNSLYLDQTHVPLIIRFPGRVTAGIRSRQPVSLTRLPDTLLFLSGQRLSPLATAPMTTTASDDGNIGDAVITEVSRRRFVPEKWPTAHGWLKAVVTERWHFILAENGTRELYDRIADPREEHNRGSDPDLKAVVDELENSLLRAAMPAEHAQRVSGPGASEEQHGRWLMHQ